MSLVTGVTTASTVQQAVQSLQGQLLKIKPVFLIYFASSNFDPDELCKAMSETFKGVEQIGCTTAGELVSGQMLQNSIVAMAFDEKTIRKVKVSIVEGISKDENNISEAVNEIEDSFGQSLLEMDFHKYVGIILTDGMSLGEEKVMDSLGNLSNITFIGGSAGDDLKFKKADVYANGKNYQDAAVLALLEPTNGFDIIKTQSFKVLETKLTPTKVNEAVREVIEFNGKPATQAYAEAVGMDIQEAQSYFKRHPLGLISDGDPYVRSPQQFKGESVLFYCNVSEDMELSLLESGDIIGDTAKALENKKHELGKIEGVVNFHCILRTLELREQNLESEYGKVFSDVPMIGFSTYGEQYVGHINQTSTILVFK